MMVSAARGTLLRMRAGGGNFLAANQEVIQYRQAFTDDIKMFVAGALVLILTVSRYRFLSPLTLRQFLFFINVPILPFFVSYANFCGGIEGLQVVPGALAALRVFLDDGRARIDGLKIVARTGFDLQWHRALLRSY